MSLMLMIFGEITFKGGVPAEGCDYGKEKNFGS